MDTFFKNNRKLIRLGIVAFIMVVIPLTLYLVRTGQIFKPKAVFGQPTLDFIVNGVTNPASTNSQVVGLHISWNGAFNQVANPTNNPTNPTQTQNPATTPTTPPTSGNGQPTLTLTPNNITLPATVTVSWSNITPQDVNYAIQPHSVTVGQVVFLDKTTAYLGTCTATPAQSVSDIPSTGSCTYNVSVRPGILNLYPEDNSLSFVVYHFASGIGASSEVASSNSITMSLP